MKHQHQEMYSYTSSISQTVSEFLASVMNKSLGGGIIITAEQDRSSSLKPKQDA